MKFGLLLVIPIICLLYPLSLDAQQYSLRHFSVNEGLIQSDVNKIIQDNKRYIWIATNGGVSRFDGLKIKSFKIPISQISYDIVEGNQNELYALMNKGIGMLRNDSVFAYHFEEDMQLGKCRNLVFSGGKLWMITNRGITFFDGKRFIVTQSLKEHNVNAVWFAIDNKKVMWIEDSDRKIWYTEKNKLKRFEVAGSLLRDGQDLGVNQNGHIYKIQDKKMVFLDDFDRKELNYLQYNNDYWYFSTKHQVFRKKGSFTELLFEAPENDRISALLIDIEGRLWIGTHNGFYFSNSLAFTKYFIPDRLGNLVWGIVEDNSKNLWFTSFGEGLTKYDGREFKKSESYKNELNTDTFYIGSTKKSDGTILFSTIKGILQFDGKRFLKIRHLPDQIYLHIYEDVANGTMIYAGENSVVIATKETVKVYDNLKFHLPQIFNILKDSNNIYRMGGAETTVFYDGRSFLSPDTAKFGYTKGMYGSVKDSKGNIWMATRYGIMLYDYKTCKRILTDEIDEAVFDLKMYFGKIYFGTIKGVGLIDPDRFYKNETAVSYFDFKNGYPGEEVVQNGAIVASDSTIWIPATRGVTRFSPSRIKTVNYLPPIQLESLIANDQNGVKIIITGYELNNNGKIVLAYKNRDLEINYHCNYFSNSEEITYYYKLENYDNSWHKVPFNVRSLKYNKLPAGEYVFNITAFNKEGAVTAIPTVIYIKIDPPFWLQWWFRVFLLMIVLLIAFELFRSMKKKERKKAEIQQQILKLKADALAAQMNPHFVFNCISSINALINLGDKQNATLYLGRFATLLRSVLKSVRLNEISLEEELLMTENYMQLEQARYLKPFIYTITRPEGISPSLILILPLIIHPYVENSILHGFTGMVNNEKRIDILAVITDDRLKVVIKDNGLGIIPDKLCGAGLGTKITNERIALLESNAHVHIESHTDDIQHGTIVTISIPLKIKN